MLNQSELANQYAKAWKQRSSDPSIPAQKYMQATGQYIDGGMTAMQGKASSAAGVAGAAAQLANVWRSRLNSDQEAAQRAKIVHNLLQQTITSGGKHGMGSLKMDNPSLLENALRRINKSSPASEELKARMTAQETEKYVKQALFHGCGVPPDFIPDISGLS